MNVLKELHTLREKVLNTRLIANDLKEELANEIFQIETEIALNYTRSCVTLKDKEAITFDELKHLEYKHNVLNELANKQVDNVKLQLFENGKWREVNL